MSKLNGVTPSGLQYSVEYKLTKKYQRAPLLLRYRMHLYYEQYIKAQKKQQKPMGKYINM